MREKNNYKLREDIYKLCKYQEIRNKNAIRGPTNQNRKRKPIFKNKENAWIKKLTKGDLQIINKYMKIYSANYQEKVN